MAAISSKAFLEAKYEISSWKQVDESGWVACENCNLKALARRADAGTLIFKPQ